MKIIRGTRDAKGNVIQKQPSGGVGQQRCMKCHQICQGHTQANGQVTMRCNGCGAQYTSTAMDAPKAPAPGALPTRSPR